MKEKILAVLERECPDIDFLASDQLVTDGIVDSLTLTMIVAAFTKEFGVAIPYEEITVANFDSVEGLAAMMERLTRA